MEPSVVKGTSYFLLSQGVCLCIAVFCLHSLGFCVDIRLVDFPVLSSYLEEVLSPMRLFATFLQ